MKFSKKMSLVLGLSVVLVSSLASTSMAVVCQKAEILGAGATSATASTQAGNTFIAVKCLDAGTTYPSYAQFFPMNSISDQALATALTAMSLNKTLWIRTADTVSGSLLNIVYVNK